MTGNTTNKDQLREAFAALDGAAAKQGGGDSIAKAMASLEDVQARLLRGLSAIAEAQAELRASVTAKLRNPDR